MGVPFLSRITTAIDNDLAFAQERTRHLSYGDIESQQPSPQPRHRVCLVRLFNTLYRTHGGQTRSPKVRILAHFRDIGFKAQNPRKVVLMSCQVRVYEADGKGRE
jgi:hypothetical protein